MIGRVRVAVLGVVFGMLNFADLRPVLAFVASVALLALGLRAVARFAGTRWTLLGIVLGNALYAVVNARLRRWPNTSCA